MKNSVFTIPIIPQSEKSVDAMQWPSCHSQTRMESRAREHLSGPHSEHSSLLVATFLLARFRTFSLCFADFQSLSLHFSPLVSLFGGGISFLYAAGFVPAWFGHCTVYMSLRLRLGSPRPGRSQQALGPEIPKSVKKSRRGSEKSRKMSEAGVFETFRTLVEEFFSYFGAPWSIDFLETCLRLLSLGPGDSSPQKGEIPTLHSVRG